VTESMPESNYIFCRCLGQSHCEHLGNTECRVMNKEEIKETRDILLRYKFINSYFIPCPIHTHIVNITEEADNTIQLFYNILVLKILMLLTWTLHQRDVCAEKGFEFQILT
jgi:hypothetical protein